MLVFPLLFLAALYRREQAPFGMIGPNIANLSLKSGIQLNTDESDSTRTDARPQKGHELESGASPALFRTRPASTPLASLRR